MKHDAVVNKIDFHNSSIIYGLLKHDSVLSEGYTLNIGVHSAVSQYLIPMGSVELNPRSKRTKRDADYWPGTSNQPLSIVYNDQLVTIGNYTLYTKRYSAEFVQLKLRICQVH